MEISNWHVYSGNGSDPEGTATERAAECLLAEVVGVEVDDLVMRRSPDGSRVYGYATEAEADADDDGAYTPHYIRRDLDL